MAMLFRSRCSSAAEDAATIPALQSGKAPHARHPGKARGRARDAVEFADEAKILDCHSKQSIEQDGYQLWGVLNAPTSFARQSY
jgi:hypothetical protein